MVAIRFDSRCIRSSFVIDVMRITDSGCGMFHRSRVNNLVVTQARAHLMMARMWHRRTKASDAEAYLEYLFQSGIPAYRATKGNRGAGVLRRAEGGVGFLGAARRH